MTRTTLGGMLSAKPEEPSAGMRPLAELKMGALGSQPAMPPDVSRAPCHA